NRMGEMFQACLTLPEAYGVIGQLAPRLFAGQSGAVFASNPSRQQLEVVAKWGRSSVGAPQFAPNDCWALRNTRTHVAQDTGDALLCRHLPIPIPPAYLCTPLVAQGSSLGVLHVASEDGHAAAEGLSATKQRLAEAVAAQIGLGLVNVQLRDLLRVQSTHDP